MKFTREQLKEMMEKETALGKIRAILNGEKDIEPYCNFTLYDLCETALALYDGYVPQDIAIEIVEFLQKAGCGKPGKPNTIWAMVQEIITERDQWIRGFNKMAESDEAENKERMHWQEKYETATSMIKANLFSEDYVDGLEKVLETILADATADLKKPDKRLWPLRADNYRTARRLLEEKS